MRQKESFWRPLYFLLSNTQSSVMGNIIHSFASYSHYHKARYIQITQPNVEKQYVKKFETTEIGISSMRLLEATPILFGCLFYYFSTL